MVSLGHRTGMPQGLQKQTCLEAKVGAWRVVPSWGPRRLRAEDTLEMEKLKYPEFCVGCAWLRGETGCLPDSSMPHGLQLGKRRDRQQRDEVCHTAPRHGCPCFAPQRAALGYVPHIPVTARGEWLAGERAGLFGDMRANTYALLEASPRYASLVTQNQPRRNKTKSTGIRRNTNFLAETVCYFVDLYFCFWNIKFYCREGGMTGL